MERESDLLGGDLVDFSAIAEETKPNIMDDSQFQSSSKGFCVKEFREKMDNLEKENFNLRLKVFYLEQNGSNTVPEGIENFQREFFELKNENDSLIKDLREKQDLLQQASIALELLEEEKLSSSSSAEYVIEDLKNKIESLQLENANLHQAVSDVNQSNLGNDTGYADFLGAVDKREIQRKMYEMTQMTDEYKKKMSSMKDELLKLQKIVNESESKISALQYERDELKDKFNAADSQSREKELEKELADCKEKWAGTQCDVMDLEQKLKDSEKEQQKAVKYLSQSLQKLEEEHLKVEALKSIVERLKLLVPTAENAEAKDAEILALKKELDEAKNKLKIATSSELTEKNKEIQQLTAVVNQLKLCSNSQSIETPRFSLDLLHDSFNDLKFQQAMEIKKQSQKKVNELMQELISLSNSKTKQQMLNLKEQMSIIADKQEMTDDALTRCTELCSHTMECLQEFAHFIATLIQNKEIRESLSNQNLLDIQNILDKSIEFSRYSIDGRVSALPDLSMLGDLINSARDSIVNIQRTQNDIVMADQAIQSTLTCSNCDDLQHKLKMFSADFSELKSVNQLLEDEICEYRQHLQARDKEIQKCQENINLLQESEKEVKAVVEDCKMTIQSLHIVNESLSSKFESTNETAQMLENRLQEIEKDLSENWILKADHEEYIEKVRDEVVNAEAQTAAIRLELDELTNEKLEGKFDITKTSFKSEDIKEEDACLVSSNNLELAQFDTKLESSQVTKVDYCDDELLATCSSISCSRCPKYQEHVQLLKTYLKVCLEKLRKDSDGKFADDVLIQSNLVKTGKFLSTARLRLNEIKTIQNTKNNVQSSIDNKENIKH